MAGPRHALTLRSKCHRSNPNPNRPAWVHMSIRRYISLHSSICLSTAGRFLVSSRRLCCACEVVLVS